MQEYRMFQMQMAYTTKKQEETLAEDTIVNQKLEVNVPFWR